ncbi:NAD(P)/FAD-dependent oxidoreductase [Bordetella bronchiseptica]|uniref:NAD(P)/FAD-dependent oxidoreductase n=1 Tax=Bordetella bronchiseptica TaxID=518 RepID=UPI004049CED9
MIAMVAGNSAGVSRVANQPLEHEPSYWAATAEIEQPSPALEHDLDVDVAIIGAGYTGLSTAYHLKKDHGITATVVEANRIGWGCSGRNGGFAMIGVGKDTYNAWISKVGLEQARKTFEFGRDAVRTLRTVLQENNINAASGNEGFLLTAHRRARISELIETQRQLKHYFGFDTEYLDAHDVRTHYLSGTQIFGALHYPEHFPIHPMRYAQGLGRRVRQLGVPIYENSPVNTWRRAGRLHELLTPRGVVRAKKVVIATNGYTPDGLHPIVRGRLMNVLSNIVVTAPLSEGQLAATRWQTHKMVVDTRNLRSYFRLLEDNRIMFGARGGISDTAASRATMKAWLLTQLAKQFPGLGAIGADYFWQGWVAIPRDKGPHIHVADNGSVAYWLGCTGTGVAMSTHAGKLLADSLATERRPDVPALVGAPLPRYEIPALRKLYQRAAYSYFYLKDEFL